MILESLINSNRFTNEGRVTKRQLKKAIEEAIKQIDKNIVDFGECYPTPATKNDKYELIKNIEWTNGFWTGMIWLAYEYTKDEKYKKLAEKHVDDFLERIENNIEVEHHDLGFLYIPSCVSAYKITGSERGKKAAILAADKLISRFQEKGGFIQAWGELGKEDNYRLIVDCLLNIPLLYWASDVTGESKYKELAECHYNTTIKTAIRENASTYHTFYFNPETGEPVKGITRQGYSDESSWARGQAWAVYGVALHYSKMKKSEDMDLFKCVYNYYLNRLPEDHIPYWDLIFTDGSLQSRDSSAAAVAICGINEILKYMPESDDEKGIYVDSQHAMLKVLIDEYTSKGNENANSLLMHGVYSWHSGKGVDQGNIWGDYFYLEALIRFYKDWELYW